MRGDGVTTVVEARSTRRRGTTALSRYWPPLATVAVVLVVWEIVGRAVDPLLFAPPSLVVSAFGELVASGRLPAAFVQTMSYLIPGFAISVVTGIALGVLIGRSVTWGKLLEPYIDAIYATPRVVIIPLVIVWFGVGYSGRMFIIWLGTVIPIILNTAIGVRYTRADLIETARSFLATERHLVRHVVLPGAVPFVISGLRIGAERALVGAVIAEVFLSLTGIGGIIQTEAERFNTAYVLAAASVYAAFGWIIITALGALENRFAVWRSR